MYNDVGLLLFRKVVLQEPVLVHILVVPFLLLSNLELRIGQIVFIIVY